MKPRMEFSGVRSSWLVLDRNEFFAWVALVAMCMAVVSSAFRLASSPSARVSDSLSQPISSPALGAGSSRCPAPSRTAFTAFAPTRLEMPEVKRAMPARPASSPSARPMASMTSMIVASLTTLLC